MKINLLRPFQNILSLKSFKTFICIFICTISVQAQAPFSKDNITLINGYNNAIEGEVIPYFSVYKKYVKEALLTRCTDGKKTIAWETDTIPEYTSGDYAYFTWIAAHSSGTSSGDRNFDLYINDVFALSFTTHEKQYPEWWNFRNADSTMLSFEFKTRDGANDSHGMAYLRVPLKKYKKGTTLRLKIIGQNQQSNDWFMTFKYAFAEKIEVASMPFLLKDKMHQLLSVTVLHFGKSNQLHLNVADNIEKNFKVQNGFNSFEVEIPAVKQTTSIPVKARIDNILSVNELVQVHLVTYRELDLIHHAHVDIGYSNIQEEVIQIHINNIRQALYLIEKTKNYSPESKFKWNIESSWALENFLKVASAEEKRKLFSALRNKQILVSGFYANILTGLCMPEEIEWISDYSSRLGIENKFPVKVAMLTDVPGLNWTMVGSLAKKGIRYFSNGINFMPGMPGTGDRVGHTLDAFGDKPFWWKSPSGKDSILMFCGAKGYSSWHGTGQGAVFENGPEKIAAYLNELDEKKYPYDMVHWRYNIVSDNGPTDSTISDFVSQWNQKYASPKLVLANAQDFFERFENKYGKIIPSFSGDFTPYWEDGAYSTAREETNNRLNSAKIIALEKIAKHKNISINNELLYNAKRFVVLFHEHTWGAYNSISEPDAPFVVHQWKYKKSYLDSALLFTKQLEDVVLKNQAEKKTVVVINSLPFSRSGFVEIDCPKDFTGNILKDESGKEILVQHLQNGQLGFIVKDIPANGEKKYTLVNKKINAVQSFRTPFSIKSNKETGNINSIKTKETEWVDTAIIRGLARLLYVNGLNPLQYESAKFTNSNIIETGPVVTTLQMNYSLPGTNGVTCLISRFNNLDYLKVTVTINKEAVRKKESVHIAFPFKIDKPVTTIGNGDGVYGPDFHQLPGANKDYYSVQHWINVGNENQNVTVVCPQGALYEIGKMVNEEKNKQGYKEWLLKGHSSALIFLYAMNNYWHTNSKADQEGISSFDFYLKFENRKMDIGEANRFGYEAVEPLMVVPAKLED